MLLMEAKKVSRGENVRLEVVDNWHEHWPMVLESIDSTGQRESLLLDKDGWLSARQNVLAAFVDNRVVGHLCFRVQPMKSGRGNFVIENGRAVMEAQVDAFSVEDKYDDVGVDRLLVDMAEEHARALKCREFRTNWH